MNLNRLNYFPQDPGAGGNSRQRRIHCRFMAKQPDVETAVKHRRIMNWGRKAFLIYEPTRQGIFARIRGVFVWWRANHV